MNYWNQFSEAQQPIADNLAALNIQADNDLYDGGEEYYGGKIKLLGTFLLLRLG